jgi:predicted transcriptional regulator
MERKREAGRNPMLLLSIHPKHVERIFQGEKQVELRRRRPRSQPGDWIAVYSTSPVKQLVGVVQIKEVRVKSPESLWRNVRGISGLTRQEFTEYFDKSHLAIGIVIQNPRPFPKPVELPRLREEWDDFHPPQSYRYLTDPQINFVWRQFSFQRVRRRAA